MNIPTGFGTNNGPNWAGRYYSDEFTYFLVAVSPSIAYRVNEQLSLGAGISASYTSTESSTRINNDPFLPGAGIFHRLQNDWEITWDIMWMQFSEFGTTEITISDNDKL